MMLIGKCTLRSGKRILDEQFRGCMELSNPSRYVHNDPLNSTDPSGLDEIPKGTPENNYQGLGEWEFDSKDEAYKFFEKLLSAEERPKRWKEKVNLGCVGLNSLRVGDPSGVPNPIVFQNAFTRKDAKIFKSKPAAEALLSSLVTKNPGKTYYLVAVQISATGPGKKKYSGLGEGPFAPNDLNGIIDFSKFGDFNFATLILTEKGDSYWEWVNHGLDVKGKGPVTVTHSEDLPDSYDATFYLVVEKLKWKD